MANLILCEGNIVEAVASSRPVPNVVACDTGWTVIPYVEPTDSTAIYSQLVALNEFDAQQAAFIIVTCLVTFLVGFGTGVVIKLLRRL
jgi:hypothetical protein